MAIVVVSPVVAIDMELTVVEIKVSSPNLVASLSLLHCRFTISLTLLYVAAEFYNQDILVVINQHVALDLTKTEIKNCAYL